LARLEELARRKGMGTLQLEDKPINLWPDRLHHVQCERAACLQIGMQHTHPGVKPDREDRNARFRLEDGIEVVPQRVRRVCGAPR
jgi:hypothetical protein